MCVGSIGSPSILSKVGWATRYDDGTTRPRLIGLFQGERQLAVILRIEQEGSILYSIMNADDKRLDKLRIGKLLYARSKI